MFCSLHPIHGYSQNNSFVIGTDSMYSNNVNLVLWSGHGDNYWLDVNNDSIYDFHFVTYAYGSGASGMEEYTKLTPFDSTYIATIEITDSTCYPIDVYNLSNYILVDKFNFLDTLNNNNTYSDSSKYIAYIYNNWNWPSCSIDDRDYWVGQGFKYIGFKKIINSIEYWGWIQVKVVGYGQIEIKNFIFSYIPNAINEVNFDNSIKIYPNPANNFIQIEGLNVLSYSIFDFTGKQIEEQLISINNINLKCYINISNLFSGIYFIKVKTDKGNRSFKFVKK